MPSSSPSTSSPPSSSSSLSPSPAQLDHLSTSALFELGRSLLSSHRWPLACEALSRCVERTAASDGEESLTVAPLYHQYGRALFENWKATQTALGEAVHEAQGRLGKIGEGEGGLLGEEDDAMDDGEEDGSTAANGSYGDDDAAWEVLDLARVIYSRHFTPASAFASPSSAAPLLFASSSSSSASGSGVGLSNADVGLSLSNVLLLLGDLHQEQEQWAEAYGDYQQALSIQTQLRPLHHRDIASTHTELAVCSLYQSQPAQALVHYTQAYNTLHYHLMWRTARIRDIISRALAGSAGEERLSEELAVEKRLVEERVSGVEAAWKEVEAERKTMAECQDFIDEMRERIDEMKKEMTKPTVDPASASASSAFPSSSASSSAASGGVASAGFLSSPFAIPSLSFGPTSAASAASSSSSPSPSLSLSSSASTPSLKRKAEDNGTASPADNGTGGDSVCHLQVKRKQPKLAP